jgi:phosphonate transport system permease protein
MARDTGVRGTIARPLPFGTRTMVFMVLLLAGVWAAHVLELHAGDLVPSKGGLEKAGKFFRAALHPSLYSEDPQHADVALWPEALEAARLTVVYSAAAVGLSVILGLFLGFLGSTAWWAGDLGGGALLRRSVAPAIYGVTRVVITAMRSIHEVLWAVMFACVWPQDMRLAAVIAIAIPYSGTFAKLFSEIIDETPRNAAVALRLAGARPFPVFLFGLAPRALPEMIAYTVYRFECGLRAAAVLGWFGIPTVGEKIMRSDENLFYGEVWLYLYTLIALIGAVEWWSSTLRRRLVG